jgi:hypothetical protein
MNGGEGRNGMDGIGSRWHSEKNWIDHKKEILREIREFEVREIEKI